MVAISASIGIALASVNSGLTMLIAFWALKKSVVIVSVATALGMFVRLAALAVIFFVLVGRGYLAGPLLLGFVTTYTMLLGIEMLVFSKKRSS